MSDFESKTGILEKLRDRPHWLQMILVVLAVAGTGALVLQPLWETASPPRSPEAVLPAIPPSDVPVLPVPTLELTGVAREKALLGRRLFEDPRLSPAGMACAGCHRLDHYGTLDQPRSPSLVEGSVERNIPSIFNVGLNSRIGWDGQLRSLAAQLDQVLHNPRHMASSWAYAIQAVAGDAGYRAAFARLYDGVIDRASLTDAIVRFEQALLTPDAPFDRYLKGEAGAISAAARQGYERFRDYGCIACHQGRNLGGNLRARFGIFGDPYQDPAFRNHAEVTAGASDGDEHTLRVPPLRNVAVTGPYFHTGDVADLDEVVQIMGRYQLGREIPQEEVQQILAFLKSLTASPPEILR